MLNETEELVKLCGLDRFKVMAVFTLHLDGAFDQDPLEKKFMTRGTAIFTQSI